MAKLDGGIFSKPRGKTGGIVFGAARSRTGKVATARQFVPPSNPNTPAQQQQRTKFSESLATTRGIGKGVYGSDFNRAVSQLPGFQSVMSILLKNIDSSFVFSAPAATNLGILFPAPNMALSSPFGGGLQLDWDTDLGPNGTANDQLQVIAIKASPGASPEDRVVTVQQDAALRSAGNDSFTVGATGDYLIATYWKGAGAAEGLLSVVNWEIFTISP